MRIAALVVILSATHGASALAQELADPEAGRDFARRVCAECHAVGEEDLESPNAAAPPFTVIANTPGMTAAALRFVLSNPHREMPDLVLDGERLRDVVAYLLTLRRND